MTASRYVLCLENMVRLPIKGSSEGKSSAPPATAANTEEQGEQVDDIGDELDVDQLDSFWIEVCTCDAGFITLVNLEVCKLGRG